MQKNDRQPDCADDARAEPHGDQGGEQDHREPDDPDDLKHQHAVGEIEVPAPVDDCELERDQEEAA